MALSEITAFTPQFTNYNNVYNYKRLPLTNDEGDPSDALVLQEFDDAMPAVYSDTTNWLAPVTESVPATGIPGVLSAMTNVDIDNIFNIAGAEDIIGIISGNITWNNTLDNNVYLRLTVTVPSLNGGSAYVTTMIVPNQAANYYVYLTDASYNKIKFTEAFVTNANIDNAIVDSSNVIIKSSYDVESTINNWEYTEVESHDSTPARHIGILHAADFTITNVTRVIVFDGRVSPPAAIFNTYKTTTAQVSDRRTIRAFMTVAGWPSLTSSAGNTTYEITSCQVVDGTGGTPQTLNINHYYTVSYNTGTIICRPNYRITTTPVITTIYPNDTWTWSERNTTKVDSSGTFGGAYYTVGAATGAARVVVNATVNSANVRSTKTGVNSTWLVEHFKGSASVSDITVNLPIVNGQVHVYGIWYLQYGSANYLHPGYSNWHNGSGSLTVKSITF